MKTLDFSGTPREVIGKKENKKLRKDFKVPAVLYGSKDNLNFYVDEIQFEKILSSPDLHLINLEVGKVKTRAIIQDVQYDPMSDRPIHIDFLEALPGKAANLNIPVKITGNSIGVMAGGQLVVKMRKLRVRGVPADMPDAIEIDITKLNIGKSIKIADIKGFNFLDPENSVIVRVKAARNIAALEPELDEEETEEVEGEEGEEGAPKAEGEGAEGGEKKEEQPAAES